MEISSPSEPPDKSSHEVEEGEVPRVALSFREVVASSTQWFSEARKIVTSSRDWEDAEDLNPEGDLSVQFNKVTLDRLRSPWRLTLMGKCLGISVKPNLMESRVRAMWRIKGSLEVIDVGHDVYLFKFTQTDDYDKALFGGPWFILDHYLMISTWRPNFRPSKNGFDSMSVWIRIDELPIEYYDKEALFTIARVVGTPIRVDYATDKITRGRYARVCVKIMLSKPLITRVWVGGAWQAIQYENVSSLCFVCGRIGHLQQVCVHTKIDQNREKGKEKMMSSPVHDPSTDQDMGTREDVGVNGPMGSLNGSMNLTKDQDHEYGPRTLVSRKTKPKSRSFAKSGPNSRINDYKKGVANRNVATTSSGISLPREGTQPKSNLHAKTSQITPPNPSNDEGVCFTSASNVEGGSSRVAVHLASSTQHVARSPMAIPIHSSSKMHLNNTVNQVNTLSQPPQNLSTTPVISSSLPPSSSPSSNLIHGEQSSTEIDMYAVESESARCLAAGESHLDSERAAFVPSQGSSDGCNRGYKGTRVSVSAGIVAVVSSGFGDATMHNGER